MKKIFILIAIASSLFIISVNAESNNVKKDSKEAWKETKEGSKEAWKGTKKASKGLWGTIKSGSKEAWRDTKKAVHHATED